MELNKVTITGADESINSKELIELSKQYPFVEWGILFSKSSQGVKPRYPSLEWIENFINEIVNSGVSVNISAHICGAYMREILQGSNTLPDVVKKFNRLQFNFKYYDSEVNEESFVKLLINDTTFFGSEIILQLRNDLNDNLFYNLEKIFSSRPEVTISGLLDCSGGTGKEIDDNFPLLISRFKTYFGYAGGINPNNISSIIQKIGAKGKDNQDLRYWIDMESGVRTKLGDKDFFDLNKVNDCLLISKNYVIL